MAQKAALKSLGNKMKPLVEKLVENEKFRERCLTAKHLEAGFPVPGDSYKISEHAVKHAPKEDKGFNIELSCYNMYNGWHMQFRYGKYSIGANLPLWTGASAVMIVWLESIVSGRTLGVSFDEEGNDLHLFAHKIDDRYTNFIFFSCIDWQANINAEYPPIKYSGKRFAKKAVHVRIETKKLVNMFYSALQKYAQSVGVIDDERLEEYEIPSNVCKS